MSQLKAKYVDTGIQLVLGSLYGSILWLTPMVKNRTGYLFCLVLSLKDREKKNVKGRKNKQK